MEVSNYFDALQKVDEGDKKEAVIVNHDKQGDKDKLTTKECVNKTFGTTAEATQTKEQKRY